MITTQAVYRPRFSSLAKPWLPHSSDSVSHISRCLQSLDCYSSCGSILIYSVTCLQNCGVIHISFCIQNCGYYTNTGIVRVSSVTYFYKIVVTTRDLVSRMFCINMFWYKRWLQHEICYDSCFLLLIKPWLRHGIWYHAYFLLLTKRWL